MNLSQKLFVARKLAILTLFSMFVQLVTPVAAFALTSGPSAPEFSSFEPVATNNMVDLFSGDFTYNIPVLDIPGAHGGGYAMSLSYHSGASLEEEASWVGYGWTLNPGAINHGKQGFSDDWNGVPVNYYNKTKPNNTVSVDGNYAFEAFSVDLGGQNESPVNISAGAGVSYNNYKGFRWSAQIGASLGGGIVSLGYSVNNNGDSPFSLGINPLAIIDGTRKKGTNTYSKAEEKKEDKKEVKKTHNFGHSASSAVKSFASNYGIPHIINPDYSFSATPSVYNGFSAILAVSTMFAVAVPAGPTLGLSGSFTRQVSQSKVCNAYGYMNTPNSNSSNINVTDYRVENNNLYNNRSPFIGVPINNADSYIVTGEGAMGGFRPYSKTGVGFSPTKSISSTVIINPSVDINVASEIGMGSDAKVGAHILTVDEWSEINAPNASSNVANKTWNSPSSNEDNAVEPYFFRFNNDMADGVFNGNSAPCTADIQKATLFPLPNTPTIPNLSQRLGCQTTNPFPTTDNNKRIRRSSFIDYNTFDTANKTVAGPIRPYLYGKDPRVATYPDLNNTSDTYNKQIREFSTVNKDGMTYVYGLPVFSRNEASISYNADAIQSVSPDSNPDIIRGNVIAGIDSEGAAMAITDASEDNEINTKIGQATAAPYAANYLLTAITTPDYQDRTNNGPSDDDFGGYTRFIYEKVYGEDNWYQWRIPYNGFIYQKMHYITPMTIWEELAGEKKKCTTCVLSKLKPT